MNDIKDIIDQVYETDDNLQLVEVEHIKKIDAIEERTIIRFKRLEPEVHYKIDESNHIDTLQHLMDNKGTKTARFNSSEPNESNGPKANTEDDECELNGCFKTTDNPIHKYCSEHTTKPIDETCTMMTCLSDDCNKPVDGDSDYCFDHKHNIIKPITEKGKELNKTLDTHNANSSKDNTIDIKICRKAQCDNEARPCSQYCIEHRPTKKKAKRICKHDQCTNERDRFVDYCPDHTIC